MRRLMIALCALLAMVFVTRTVTAETLNGQAASTQTETKATVLDARKMKAVVKRLFKNMNKEYEGIASLMSKAWMEENASSLRLSSDACVFGLDGGMGLDVKSLKIVSVDTVSGMVVVDVDVYVPDYDAPTQSDGVLTQFKTIPAHYKIKIVKENGQHLIDEIISEIEGYEEYLGL